MAHLSDHSLLHHTATVPFLDCPWESLPETALLPLRSKLNDDAGLRVGPLLGALLVDGTFD
jgi:hypothetical protein